MPMEQINNMMLSDPLVIPNEIVLKNVLGKSFPAYTKLIEMFEKYGLTHEWKYYRDGKAWLCKVQKKTRTIVWMSAWKGYVRATIYFPEKYIDGIYTLNISEEEKEKIKATKNVGKAKPCMFDIKTEKVLSQLEN